MCSPPTQCPVFLSVFYLLLKAIRMAEWIFPVTPWEAAAACVGSLKTLVHVVSPSSLQGSLGGHACDSVVSNAQSPSQHVHEQFKQKEMHRFYEKTKPKPVKLMLALRQHFLCHFPLWDRSSHDRYSLELWTSLLLLHMFIKHWCCVLVLYWCTGTLTGARLKTEEFSAWKKLSFPIFRNNAGSLSPGLVARGGWLLTQPWVYLQHIFLGQTSCQGMFPGALSLRGAEKTWILSRSPRPEGSTLQLPTLL